MWNGILSTDYYKIKILVKSEKRSSMLYDALKYQILCQDLIIYVKTNKHFISLECKFAFI